MLDRKDIEDIILCMADIVMENRDLRYEVERLRKVNDEYVKSFNDMVKNSQEADRNLFKMILEYSLMGDKVV